MNGGSPALRDDQSVLRLRLATLRRNLEHVQQTVQSVKQRRKEIDVLAEVFAHNDGIQSRADDLADNLDFCLRKVRSIAEGPGGDCVPAILVTRLEECVGDIDNLQKKADTSSGTISEMTRRWPTLAHHDDFDAHVKEIFEDEAGKLIKKIDGLSTNPEDAWKEYRKSIQSDSETLFSEYVEFLAGLSLRDTGLGGPVTAEEATEAGRSADGAPRRESSGGPSRTNGHHAASTTSDVYAMTDDLIKQLYGIGGVDLWHSLTIPARRDAAARTLARMVRLGFPEWTVWGVPLAAYEFGRVVVEHTPVDEVYEKEIGGTFQGLETVIADVFATYVMGPAYAFAAVYFLLDPGHERPLPEALHSLAGEPVRSDSYRAHVMFRTLDLMDGDSGELTSVVTALRNHWATAVDESGGPALPAPGQMERFDRLTDFAWGHWSGKAKNAGYTAGRWSKAAGVDPLPSVLAEGSWRLHRGEEDVRDLINAAWFQRVNRPELAEHELARTTIRLWRDDFANRGSRDPNGKSH